MTGNVRGPGERMMYPTAKNHSPLPRMRQLDSLRTLAFLAVALSHWVPHRYQFGLPAGMGVQLFFVLSGFLITGILLDYRRASEASPELTLRRVLGVFYTRRALRIFPLFYATLAVAWLLNVEPIRVTWPWHAAYASNFYFFSTGKFDAFQHFWSLAVEEQFYLFWPAAVLFLPRRVLPGLIAGLIFFAPLFRLIFESSGHRANYLPLACFDSLGMGAWLAGASRREFTLGDFLRPIPRCFRQALPIAGFVSLTSLWLAGIGTSWVTSLGHTLVVFLFAEVVQRASRGFGGFAGRVLDWGPLVWLGQISYGLYVFHHFFTGADFAAVFRMVGLPEGWAELLGVRLVMQLGATIALGAVSWYCLEKPLNDLKRFIQLEPKKADPISTPTAASLTRTDAV